MSEQNTKLKEIDTKNTLVIYSLYPTTLALARSESQIFYDFLELNSPISPSFKLFSKIAHNNYEYTAFNNYSYHIISQLNIFPENFIEYSIPYQHDLLYCYADCFDGDTPEIISKKLNDLKAFYKFGENFNNANKIMNIIKEAYPNFDFKYLLFKILDSDFEYISIMNAPNRVGIRIIFNMMLSEKIIMI